MLGTGQKIRSKLKKHNNGIFKQKNKQKMTKNFKLTIVLFLLFYCQAFAQTTKLADSIYFIKDSISIPTKSGVNISAIIVRKKTNIQPLPVILFYTTYYQGTGDNILGKKSADRDYVGVVAYARGIRTNLKDYAPYEHEGKDI